jgi:hypothetical protein
MLRFASISTYVALCHRLQVRLRAGAKHWSLKQSQWMKQSSVSWLSAIEMLFKLSSSALKL